MITTTSKPVNSELSWMDDNRRKLKRWSKQYRKNNPDNPRSRRFEHKLSHRLDVIFNAIYEPAMRSGSTYITTINRLRLRFIDFSGIKSLTNKTVRSYIKLLTEIGLLTTTVKRGVYTMIIKSGLRYAGSMILNAFRRGRQTFPFKRFLSYIYTNKDIKTSVDLSRSRPGTGLVDDFFNLVGDFMSQKDRELAELYDKHEKDNYWPDSKRRNGINQWRQERGIEPIPPGMPLKPPMERQERKSYDIQANRPESEIYVPSESCVAKKVITDETMAYGIAKADALRKLLGMGEYRG